MRTKTEAVAAIRADQQVRVRLPPVGEPPLVERGAEGWQFVALVDFERARGRDPLLDLARLRATTFAAWPAMAAPFNAADGTLDGSRAMSVASPPAPPRRPPSG